MVNMTASNVATADVETINGDRGSWYKLYLRDSNGRTVADIAIFGASEIAGDNLEPVKWTFDQERLNFPAPERLSPRSAFTTCRIYDPVTGEPCCEFHRTGGSRHLSCGGDNAVDHAARELSAQDTFDSGE